MENKVKRIGYLPRKRVLEIIDEISKSESISRSKVVGILVEEALDARGIANFGYSNINKSNLYKSDIYNGIQNDQVHLKDTEDEKLPQGSDIPFIGPQHFYHSFTGALATDLKNDSGILTIEISVSIFMGKLNADGRMAWLKPGKYPNHLNICVPCCIACAAEIHMNVVALIASEHEHEHLGLRLMLKMLFLIQ